MRKPSLALPLLLGVAACGGPLEAPDPMATSGVGGGGSGGAAAGTSGGGSVSVIPMGGVGGSNGGSGGVAAGASGGGTGGASGDSAGSGGGGGSAAGCSAGGSPGKGGVQCEPGMEGNGTFDQPDPGDGRPDEADGEPEGELSANKQLQSSVFGYAFTYRTYKPKAYQAGKPAALMIFQDGHHYTGNFHAPRVFDSLIADKSVPVTISVYIEPTGQRSVEYDKRTEKYPSMVMMDLIPELAKSFDLVDDPNGWAIAGHSSGGGCAFNVAWQTQKFNKVLTNSGTFVSLQEPGNHDYVDILKDEPKRPIRTTLQAGMNDLACCGTSWWTVNNEMAATLTATSYPYRFMKSSTEHGPTKWHFGDFPAAMRWLWRGYSLPHYGQ
jgi:enterochelin esterase-like enzyme